MGVSTTLLYSARMLLSFSFTLRYSMKSSASSGPTEDEVSSTLTIFLERAWISFLIKTWSFCLDLHTRWRDMRTRLESLGVSTRAGRRTAKFAPVACVREATSRSTRSCGRGHASRRRDVGRGEAAAWCWGGRERGLGRAGAGSLGLLGHGQALGHGLASGLGVREVGRRELLANLKQGGRSRDLREPGGCGAGRRGEARRGEATGWGEGMGGQRTSASARPAVAPVPSDTVSTTCAEATRTDS